MRIKRPIVVGEGDNTLEDSGQKIFEIFFDPMKKMSVFRTRLSRANCRARSATPPKRDKQFARESAHRVGRDALQSREARRSGAMQMCATPISRRFMYRDAIATSEISRGLFAPTSYRDPHSVALQPYGCIALLHCFFAT
jgi:hypothetical protein